MLWTDQKEFEEYHTNPMRPLSVALWSRQPNLAVSFNRDNSVVQPAKKLDFGFDSVDVFDFE